MKEVAKFLKQLNDGRLKMVAENSMLEKQYPKNGRGWMLKRACYKSNWPVCGLRLSPS